MNVSIIVATAHNNVIGESGSLPWRLPGEVAYFKAKTTGHPIVMGRKTYESIGRALPERTNIIITSDPDYKAEGCAVAYSLEQALTQAEVSPGNEEIFIIGGESIYTAALPLTNKIYLTKVDAKVSGDRFFKFDPQGWRQTFSEKHTADEKNKYDYEFTILERI